MSETNHREPDDREEVKRRVRRSLEGDSVVEKVIAERRAAAADEDAKSE